MQSILRRLTAPSLLLKAKIPSLVYDLHLYDPGISSHTLHILVPKDQLFNAKDVICNSLSMYRHTTVDPGSRWVGFPEGEHAFKLDEDSVLLAHAKGMIPSLLEGLPFCIFLHANSVFHFPRLDDPSRVVRDLEPLASPPSERLSYPTIPAFYDSAIDTIFGPPKGYFPFPTRLNLSRLVSDLNYCIRVDEVEDKITDLPDLSGLPADGWEQVICPGYISILQQIRFDNRPYLIRNMLLLHPCQHIAEAALERHALRKLMDSSYKAPDFPYPVNPLRTNTKDIKQPGGFLTPFLMRQSPSQVVVEWHRLGRTMAPGIMERVVL